MEFYGPGSWIFVRETWTAEIERMGTWSVDVWGSDTVCAKRMWCVWGQWVRGEKIRRRNNRRGEKGRSQSHRLVYVAWPTLLSVNFAFVEFREVGGQVLSGRELRLRFGPEKGNTISLPLPTHCTLH